MAKINHPIFPQPDSWIWNTFWRTSAINWIFVFVCMWCYFFVSSSLRSWREQTDPIAEVSECAQTSSRCEGGKISYLDQSNFQISPKTKPNPTAPRLTNPIPGLNIYIYVQNLYKKLVSLVTTNYNCDITEYSLLPAFSKVYFRDKISYWNKPLANT